MTAIYLSIGLFAILLVVYLRYAYKLRKNRPNIVGELEIFPVPEKSVSKQLDEMLEDAKKNLEINVEEELIKLVEEEEVNKEAQSNISNELTIEVPLQNEQIDDEINEEGLPAWFALQRRKALRQLKQFSFNKLEFIPDWTFEENNQIFETRGYLIDASTTLSDIVNKHLINKQRVVFYLSKESDGIYHKRIVSGANKTEATITVQAWCSKK